MSIGFLLAAALLMDAGTPSNPDEFRTELIERLHKAHPHETFAPVSEPLVIRYGKMDKGSINLHRIFAFCETASKGDCEAQKILLVANVLADAPTVRAEALRIVVRDQGYVDYLEQVRAQSEDKSPLAHYRKIGDDLYAIIAIDGPDSIAMAGEKQLMELGLSESQAWNVATGNMVGILPALPQPGDLKKGAVSLQGREYVSGILANLEGWQRVADAVGPELFMTVVAEQFVFIGTMSDERVRHFAPTVVEDCNAQPRCVSPKMYRFRDGRWTAVR